jgi:hypothetical protein
MQLPPIRAITRGPKFHWRGYYDKLLFDPSDRFVVASEIDFEHRTPEPNDRLRVGIVDLESSDEWIELGSTKAWNWQQGCMAQWLPGEQPLVIYNDREGEQFVSCVIDIRDRQTRTVSAPIYCISPDGKQALNVDFRRLNEYARLWLRRNLRSLLAHQSSRRNRHFAG